MTIDSNKFVKLKRFSQEFNFDDTADQVVPKTTAGTAVGDAIAAAVGAIPVIPDATSTVKGKVSLAVGSEVSSVSDVEAATPANVNAKIAAIDPANFKSADAGNAIGIGTDGKLKTIIPAQLPDDQVFSGDNSGNVDLTLTPVDDPVTGNTNYTILANLKVASATPNAETNLLDESASGFFVSAMDVTNAIVSNQSNVDTLAASFPIASASVDGLVKIDNDPASVSDTSAITPESVNAKIAAIVIPTKATSAETITGTDNVKFVTPKDLKDAVGAGADYPLSVTASSGSAITGAVTGTSNAVAVTASNTSTTNSEALIVTKNSAGSAAAAVITKAGSGTGAGLSITKSGSGSGDGIAVSYSATDFGTPLVVTRASAATGSGSAAEINNASDNSWSSLSVKNTGNSTALDVQKTGSAKTGQAASFTYNNTNASAVNGVSMTHSSASGGGGDALVVTKSNATAGNGLSISKTGTGTGMALQVSKSTSDGLPAALFTNTGSGTTFIAQKTGSAGGDAASFSNLSSVANTHGLTVLSSQSGSGSGDGILVTKEGGTNGRGILVQRTGSGIGSGIEVTCSATNTADAITATRTGSTVSHTIIGNRNTGAGTYAGILGAWDGATRAGVLGTAGGISGVWAGHFTGDVFHSGAITSSDRRLKSDFNETPELGELPIMQFVKKDAGVQVGVIAQDVLAVAPQLVVEIDDTGMLGIKETSVLFAMIDSMRKRLEAAEARINELEAK